MTQPLLSSSMVIPPALSGNLTGSLVGTTGGLANTIPTTGTLAIPSMSMAAATPAVSSPSLFGANSPAGMAQTPVGMPQSGIPKDLASLMMGMMVTFQQAMTMLQNGSAFAVAPSTVAAPATGLATTPAATTAAPTSSASTATAGMTDTTKTAMTALLGLLQQVLVKIKGGGTLATPTTATAVPATAAAPAAPPAAAAPAANTATSQALDRLIVGGTPTQRAQLKQNMMAIAADAEGGKLLQGAIAKGVTFAAGNPATAIGAADKGSVVGCDCAQHQADATALDGAGNAGNAGNAANGGTGLTGGAQVVIRGVTITQGGKSQIIVADPNNLKTLVHEMVHAVSTADGNSQHEEGLANVIGKRVESRLTGVALEAPTATYNNTLPNYTELARRNNIEQTLAQLGVAAGFTA